MMGGSNTSNPRLNDKIKMDSVSHSSYNGLQTLFGKEYANLYKDEIRITDLFYVAKIRFHLLIMLSISTNAILSLFATLFNLLLAMK